MYFKEPFESKYQLLINGRKKKGGNKELRNSKTFIDYSWTIDDAYEDLEKYNLTKKRKVLIVFDDLIADMKVNKNIKSCSH